MIQKTLNFYELNDVISFGKHKGKSLKLIIGVDPDYIRWCLSNIDGFRLIEEANKYYQDKLMDIEDQKTIEWLKDNPRENIDPSFFGIEIDCGT